MGARSAPPDPIHDAESRDTGPPAEISPDTTSAEGRARNTGAEPSCARSDEARALESYSRLVQVIDDYRRGSIEDEDQLSRLKARIMEVVEHELARGPSVELITPLGRCYAMTLAALRAEVRGAVDAETGVQTRRVHITDADVDTMTLDLRVTFTTSSRSSIPDLHDGLRARIAERLRHAAGLRTQTIDLIAEDIYDD